MYYLLWLTMSIDLTSLEDLNQDMFSLSVPEYFFCQSLDETGF